MSRKIFGDQRPISLIGVDPAEAILEVTQKSLKLEFTGTGLCT